MYIIEASKILNNFVSYSNRMKILRFCLLVWSLTVFTSLTSISSYNLYGQVNGSTTDQNISAEPMPQGTSLQNTSASNVINNSNSGTVESEVVPQGTSLNVTSDESNGQVNRTTAEPPSGNVTATIAPQGTGLDTDE
jgi:hypothetical protein